MNIEKTTFITAVGAFVTALIGEWDGAQKQERSIGKPCRIERLMQKRSYAADRTRRLPSGPYSWAAWRSSDGNHCRACLQRSIVNSGECRIDGSEISCNHGQDHPAASREE